MIPEIKAEDLPDVLRSYIKRYIDTYGKMKPSTYDDIYADRIKLYPNHGRIIEQVLAEYEIVKVHNADSDKTEVKIDYPTQDVSTDLSETLDANLVVAIRSEVEEEHLPEEVVVEEKPQPVNEDVMTLTWDDAMFFVPLTKYDLKAETAKQNIYAVMTHGENTVDEIAKRCGMSGATVRRYLKEMENDSITLKTELKVIDVEKNYTTWVHKYTKGVVIKSRETLKNGEKKRMEK